MNGWDIAILVVVCAAFAAVVGWLIYRKVKRKGGCCDCGCVGCSGCSSCSKSKPLDDEK